MHRRPTIHVIPIGFAMALLFGPADAVAQCVHLAGELFARVGRKDGTPGDLKMRNVWGTVGALWGTGGWDHWCEAGAMFDLGWGRVGPRDAYLPATSAEPML